MCFRYRKLLIPYSESELGTVAARNLERHLMKCARCRMELDGIRLVAGALCDTDAPAMEPADNLWARVSARIADEPVRPRRQRWFGWAGGLAAGAAAAVLVGAVGMSLLDPGTKPGAPTPGFSAKAPVASSQPGVKAPAAAKALEKAARPDVKASVATKQPSKPVDMAKVTPTTTLWAYKTTTRHPKPASGGREWFVATGSKTAGVSKTPSKKVEMAANYAHTDRTGSAVADEANRDVANGLSRGDSRAAEAIPARPAGAVSHFGLPVVTASGVDANRERARGESKSEGVSNHFYRDNHAPTPAAAPAAPGAVGKAMDWDEARGTVSGDKMASTPDLSATNGGLSTGVNLGYYYADATTSSPSSTSVVDDLNETEGIRTAAIFSYP